MTAKTWIRSNELMSIWHTSQKEITLCCVGIVFVFIVVVGTFLPKKLQTVFHVVAIFSGLEFAISC